MDTEYFTQTRREIEPLLPPKFATAMEIGCGEGSTLRWLKQDKGAARTIGIEIEPEVAARAARHVDEMRVADIGAHPDVLAPYASSVDLLLLLDVLEHLRDPLSALRGVRGVLRDGGHVIASIPNVRSVKVLFPLIFRGDFRYTDSGILDRTHVVFFTKKSILRLFEQAGFDCEGIRGNGALSLKEAKTAAGRLIAVFNAATFGAFEGFLANQWLVRARLGSAAVRGH